MQLSQNSNQVGIGGWVNLYDAISGLPAGMSILGLNFSSGPPMTGNQQGLMPVIGDVDGDDGRYRCCHRHMNYVH